MPALEEKLRTKAAAYADLAALLGSSPFRWYDTQLTQGTQFPAVVVTLVASSDTYVSNGRMPTGFSRMQFTIWANDPVTARQVDDALTCFLNQANLVGINGLSIYSNQVVLTRAGMYPNTQPPKYWRTIDASIFDNELAA